MANVLVMSQREREQAAVVKEVVNGRYSAMRRKDIATIAEANRFLEAGEYFAEHNEKFSLPFMQGSKVG